MATSDRKPPSRDLDKFIVRLPPGMRDKIAAAAKQANRTMNAEIVSRLEFTLMIGLSGGEGDWSASHGEGSPEWNAAMQRQRGWLPSGPANHELEARIKALEYRLEQSLSDEHLSRLLVKIAQRL